MASMAEVIVYTSCPASRYYARKFRTLASRHSSSCRRAIITAFHRYITDAFMHARMLHGFPFYATRSVLLPLIAFHAAKLNDAGGQETSIHKKVGSESFESLGVCSQLLPPLISTPDQYQLPQCKLLASAHLREAVQSKAL